MCRKMHPKRLVPNPPGRRRIVPNRQIRRSAPHRRHHHHHHQAERSRGGGQKQEPAPASKSDLRCQKILTPDLRRFPSRPVPSYPIPPPPAPEAEPSAATPSTPPLHLPNKSTDRASVSRSRCSRVPGRISSTLPAWGGGFERGGRGGGVCSQTLPLSFSSPHPPTSTPYPGLASSSEGPLPSPACSLSMKNLTSSLTGDGVRGDACGRSRRAMFTLLR